MRNSLADVALASLGRRPGAGLSLSLHPCVEAGGGGSLQGILKRGHGDWIHIAQGRNDCLFAPLRLFKPRGATSRAAEALKLALFEAIDKDEDGYLKEAPFTCTVSAVSMGRLRLCCATCSGRDDAAGQASRVRWRHRGVEEGQGDWARPVTQSRTQFPDRKRPITRSITLFAKRSRPPGF